MPDLAQGAGAASRVGRTAWVAAALGVAAFAGVAWLLLSTHPSGPLPAWVGFLPAFDAACNGASALCALLGFWAVRRGRKEGHKRLMLAALAWSALFLAGYLVCHYFRGETRFGGNGGLRVFYLCLLASHVGLSFFVLPLLLVTVSFAGLGFFERHRRLARWTLPLWLYVSLSGVAVYFFLRPYY